MAHCKGTDMENTQKIKIPLYLENKPKIKAFIEEVGYIHIFHYLLEELENNEINDINDMWVIRAIDGLEHAYNAYLTRDNIDEYGIELEIDNET
jgi:hypothetical protein